MMKTAALLAVHLLCASALLAADPPADARYPQARLLMGPARLAKPEVAQRFVILDARSRDAYDKSHVPHARWVDHAAWKEAFGDGQDAHGWSKRIGGLGIGSDARVVVYDDADNKDAARIWWILRYWGLDDARLLNGGWKLWQAKELPTTADPPPSVQEPAFRAAPRAERLVTKDELLAQLKTGGLQIIDTRSRDEFCGTDKRATRGGAIPGAKHLEWSDLINPKSHRFKSPAKLRQLFADAGIDLNRPTASHCQSGGRASVMAFGLELMGAKNVGNYYQGWSEWGNAEDTPVVVPKE